MTKEKWRTILEFQNYILFLNPEERRIASSLAFKQGDTLMTFSANNARKLEEMPRSPYAPPLAPIHFPQSPVSQRQRGNYSMGTESISKNKGKKGLGVTFSEKLSRHKQNCHEKNI